MVDIESVIALIKQKEVYVGSMIDVGCSYYLLLYHFDSEKRLCFMEVMFFDCWSDGPRKSVRKMRTLSKLVTAELGGIGPEGRTAFRMQFSSGSRIRSFEIFFRAIALNKRLFPFARNA